MCGATSSVGAGIASLGTRALRRNCAARAALGAASAAFSAVLTDEQQHACIAAGAKVQSRRRLLQSGPLTGQQYYVGQQCRKAKTEPERGEEKVEGGRKNVEWKQYNEAGSEVPQLQLVTESTWEPHRDLAGASPGQHRDDMGKAREGKGRSKKEEGRRREAKAAPELVQPQKVTQSTWEQCQGSARALPGQGEDTVRAFSELRGFRLRRCAWGDWPGVGEALWRRQRGAVGRARGPPEERFLPQERIR